MTRRPGEFGVGNHNEQIFYQRGVNRDRDLMMAVFMRPGVAAAVAKVLNDHLDEFRRELDLTGALGPMGVPVKVMPTVLPGPLPRGSVDD